MRFSVILISLACANTGFTRENPSLEELRWNLPQDLWSKKDEILLTGKYFRVLDNKVERNLLFYDSSNFTRDPSIVFTFPSIKKTSKGKNEECDLAFPSQEYSTNALECGYRFCKPYTGDKPVPLIGYSAFKRNYYTKDKSECPIPIDKVITYSSFRERSIYAIHKNAYESFFNIKFEDKTKDYLKVKIDNKDYFLDIRFCKNHPGDCEIINYEKSLYEHALLKLEEHKQKKDLPVFNFLLENLLPCVKKRDFDCAKKYFVTSADDVPERMYVSNYEFKKEIKLSEDDWKALEACLDYKKVLPHYIGSIGINRVCIFEGYLYSGVAPEKLKRKELLGLRIMDIAYPEAVRLSNTNTVYMEKPANK